MTDCADLSSKASDTDLKILHLKSKTKKRGTLEFNYQIWASKSPFLEITEFKARASIGFHIFFLFKHQWVLCSFLNISEVFKRLLDLSSLYNEKKLIHIFGVCPDEAWAYNWRCSWTWAEKVQQADFASRLRWFSGKARQCKGLLLTFWLCKIPCAVLDIGETSIT